MFSGVFVTHIGPEIHGPAFDPVRLLRADGIAADVDYEGRSLKAQMRSANRVMAPRVVIIGGDEPFDSLRSLTVDWRRGW